MDEVTADIFMGDFTEKFLRGPDRGRVAAGKRLRAGYYGLSYDRVSAIDDVKASRFGASSSPAFVRMCNELAGTDFSNRRSVACNGTIIEQEQILTTHNLATLFRAFGLAETLRPRMRELAERCFTWICRSLQRKRDPWKAKLQAVKNAAYAWRQMVFFVSMMSDEKQREFLAWAEKQLSAQRAEFRDRFRPAPEGLRNVVAGSTPEPKGVGPFLGWTTGKHWLLS